MRSDDFIIRTTVPSRLPPETGCRLAWTHAWTFRIRFIPSRSGLERQVNSSVCPPLRKVLNYPFYVISDDLSTTATQISGEDQDDMKLRLEFKPRDHPRIREL